jgi:hypothetical protein
MMSLDTEDERIVPVLHDVIEDTSIAAEELIRTPNRSSKQSAKAGYCACDRWR